MFTPSIYFSNIISSLSDCLRVRSGKHKAVEVFNGLWNCSELVVVSFMTIDFVWWLSRELINFNLLLVSSSRADMRRSATDFVSFIELVCLA